MVCSQCIANIGKLAVLYMDGLKYHLLEIFEVSVDQLCVDSGMTQDDVSMLTTLAIKGLYINAR